MRNLLRKYLLRVEEEWNTKLLKLEKQYFSGLLIYEKY